MKQTYVSVNNEKGFVLALSMFMLAICTMIGIASMMTSTTEVDISSNDAIYRQTFYQAESGTAIALKAMLGGDMTETYTNNTAFEGNDAIMIRDGNLLIEGNDSDNSSTRWTWSNLKDNLYNAVLPDITIRSPIYNIDVDVDKIGAYHLAGGGAEFGSGA
ncbi:MAG: pilus assembly PilX N-terminal domain-containing protein, partial [Pseudomonadota bacterium]